MEQNAAVKLGVELSKRLKALLKASGEVQLFDHEKALVSEYMVKANYEFLAEDLKSAETWVRKVEDIFGITRVPV